MTFKSFPSATYLQIATFDSFHITSNPVNATSDPLDDAASTNSSFEVYRSEDKLFLATSPIVGLLGLLACCFNTLILLVLKNK